MEEDFLIPIVPILLKIQLHLSNFLEMLALLLIPAALTYTVWKNGRLHAPGVDNLY